MAAAARNNGSDDDFELDSELEDDLTLDNIEISELDAEYKSSISGNALYHLISGYGADVTDILLQKFAETNVQLKHLSALTDEDLTMMGIKNPIVRQSLLEEFAVLPNQVEHYEKAISTTDPNKYNHDVLNNISTHLANIKTSMSIAMLEIQLKPLENNLVDEKTYASTLVLKLFDEVSKYSHQIEDELKLLEMLNLNESSSASSNTVKTKHRPNRKFKILGIIIALSMGSIVAYRALKSTTLSHHFSKILSK